MGEMKDDKRAVWMVGERAALSVVSRVWTTADDSAAMKVAPSEGLSVVVLAEHSVFVKVDQ